MKNNKGLKNMQAIQPDWDKYSAYLPQDIPTASDSKSVHFAIFRVQSVEMIRTFIHLFLLI